MRLKIYHKAEYRHSERVTNCSNELRLTPKDTEHQRVESSLIEVSTTSRLWSYNDLNFNQVHHFVVSQPHEQLVIESRSTVTTRPPIDINALPYGFLHRDLPSCLEDEECHLYNQNSTYVEVTPIIWRQAIDIQAASTDVFQTTCSIMEHIYTEYHYDTQSINTSTHASDVIRKRSGVSQDFAHAMVALCRSRHIPARYVSGYCYERARDNSLRGSEASHAWVEVYLGDHGWVGLDPTNNKVVDESYVTLAIGRDYRDVAPVIGTYYGQAGTTLDIQIKLDQLEDTDHSPQSADNQQSGK